MMNLLRELECRGRIRLAPLDPETARRLAAFAGEWLEYSAEENAIVVRHVQPGGSPALAAVPAELIALLDLVPGAARESSPGGTLVVRDRAVLALRLSVERGEIRVQWPQEDWAHARPVSLAEMFRHVEGVSARLTGTVELEAPEGAERRLNEFLEGFEGLYPEGEVDLRRLGGRLRLELRGFNVGPEELIALLRELARPPASLAAELEVGSFAPQALEKDFRLEIRAGEARVLRPALWPEP
jgi:hypothetical protein